MNKITSEINYHLLHEESTEPTNIQIAVINSKHLSYWRTQPDLVLVFEYIISAWNFANIKQTVNKKWKKKTPIQHQQQQKNNLLTNKKCYKRTSAIELNNICSNHKDVYTNYAFCWLFMLISSFQEKTIAKNKNQMKKSNNNNEQHK